MDTDATEDQRALLDVSARFMEEVCPLEVMRDPDQLDAAFSEAYRKQAAELGWFSMLVPEEHGGGSLSENGGTPLVSHYSLPQTCFKQLGKELQKGIFIHFLAPTKLHGGFVQLPTDHRQDLS